MAMTVCQANPAKQWLSHRESRLFVKELEDKYFESSDDADKM